jgi:20S proteasome alpha/beta subunit
MARKPSAITPGGSAAAARLTWSTVAGILSREPDAVAGFSSSAVLPTLREACKQAGLDSQTAELLRLGENAIYQLLAQRRLA